MTIQKGGKIFASIAILYALLSASPAVAETRPTDPGAWKKCNSSGTKTCVVDGDTIRFKGEKIRLLGFDTPESGRNARCTQENLLAEEATNFLIEKMSGAELVLERRGTDRYSRTLAILYINGKDASDLMVRSGHAIIYSPQLHRAGVWCKVKR